MITINGMPTYGAGAWDDLRFAATNTRVNPATSKPDFDFTNVEYLFDDTDTETIVMIGQMPHAWQLGSNIEPHVHWLQDASGNVKWQLDYMIMDIGDTEPGSFTTITTTNALETYTSGVIHQYSDFAEIDMSSFNRVSAILIFKLSRLGGDEQDTMSGDARFKEFDIHFKMDTPGSVQEASKW